MAMRVPPMSPDVPEISTPGIPTPQIVRPPEQAFGGENAAATERVGATAQQGSQEIFNQVLEHRQREDEQQALDLQTQFQKEVQSKLINPELDDNQMPKGYLNRQMNQAKGITGSFDQDAQELKQRYMSILPGTLQKQEMSRILSTQLVSAREKIISHEAQQTQAAFKNSFDTALKSQVDGAAGIYDPEMVNRYIASAQLAAQPGWKHSGIAEKDIPAAKAGLASEIVKSSITSLLETNPNQAQKIFDATKSQMTPLAQAQMQDTITGKKLDQTILQVYQVAQNFRMADGQIDRSKVDSYVKTLDLSPQQELQVKMHVDRLASVDASEQIKKQQDQERQFTNSLVTGQSKGLPYNEALKLAVQYGRDPTDIANKQEAVTQLYTGRQSSFDTWISKQGEPVKAAWAYAEESIKGKYGNNMGSVPGYPTNVKLSDAAISEFKQDALGKSADQIRQLVNDKLKNVVIGPGAIWGSIWPQKGEEWKRDSGVRQGIAEATARLEQDYGEDRVSAARAYLAQNQISVTPANLKALMDKGRSGETQ